MQDLRKLPQGVEIDGRTIFFEEIYSLRYLRATTHYTGTMNDKVAQDELWIYLEGAYKPIKVEIRSYVIIPFYSEKKTAEKREIIEDFHQHLVRNTFSKIFGRYIEELNSPSGLSYDNVVIYQNGDVTYSDGKVNLILDRSQCTYLYPEIQIKTSSKQSISTNIKRFLKENVNLTIDVTRDTEVFMTILKNKFNLYWN